MEKDQLASVLWDVPTSKQATVPANFLMRRVLQYGGMSLLIEAFHTYGADALQTEFYTMKPSAFEARRYHYLKHYFLV